MAVGGRSWTCVPALIFKAGCLPATSWANAAWMAYRLVNWFSGKLEKLLVLRQSRDFKAKMHQIWFSLCKPQIPLEELQCKPYSTPPDPLRGLLLRRLGGREVGEENRGEGRGGWRVEGYHVTWGLWIWQWRRGGEGEGQGVELGFGHPGASFPLKQWL